MRHGKVADILSFLPEISEQAARFEAFKKSYHYYTQKKGYDHKNAMLQSALDARDITMDFGRMGAYMRSYNRLKAFSGARAQSIYKTLETLAKSPKKYIPRMGVLLAISLGILAHGIHKGDKEYEELQEQKKKDNFIIPLDDEKFLTIKKPQGTERIIINLAELIYKVASGYIPEEDYSKEWDKFAKDSVSDMSGLEFDLSSDTSIFGKIGLAFTPTALEPLVELASDKDFYYGSQITPYGTENLPPKYQYDEYTSELAKKLGSLTNLSPAQIDHVVKGYTGGLGTEILNLTDYVASLTSKNIPEQPSKSIEEKTVLNRFITNSYKNAESISQVYDKIEEYEKSIALEEYSGQKILSNDDRYNYEQLKIAKKTMSYYSKRIKAVENSMSLSPSKKKDLIEQLKELRTDTARYYLGKEMINNANKKEIVLHEYFPTSDTYKYKTPSGISVDITLTEKDKITYAEECQKRYNELTKNTKKTNEYINGTYEERKKLLNSDLSSARNYAKDIVTKKVYERGN